MIPCGLLLSANYSYIFLDCRKERLYAPAPPQRPAPGALNQKTPCSASSSARWQLT